MNINFNIFKIFLILFISIFSFNSFLFSKEVNLKAKEVLSFDDGNLIVGKDEVEAIIENEIKVFADKISYNKKNEKLIAEGNVEAFDLINDTKIISNKIIFYKKKNQFITVGKTFFKIKKKYDGQSTDVNFYLNEKMILSENFSTFKDDFDNIIESSSFKYFNNSEILKANDIELLDKEKNKYFLKKGFFKLKENILLGKDIKVNLRKNISGEQTNFINLQLKIKFIHLIFKL